MVNVQISGTIYDAKNNANPTLAANIGAGDTVMALNTGEGTKLPIIKTGAASSTGDARTLNDTGDLAAIILGDFIHNVTDDSWAIVIETGTNTIRTTPLRGGGDNTWSSADTWAVDRFVATLAAVDANGDITKSERVLASIHTSGSDSVTVSRSFDGDTALTFDANDFMFIFVIESHVEEVKKMLAQSIILSDEIDRGQHTYAADTGALNAFTVDVDPAIEDYDDIIGKIIRFKAANTNTSTAPTIEMNGLGTKNIRKEDGATLLASGDIASGQIVSVVYDGVNFQLVSPIGQPIGTIPLVSEFFGDGSDGSFTLDGTQAAVAGLFGKSGNTYTLLRDAYFDDLTITSAPAVTLETDGYRIFCSGIFTLDGTIDANGTDGVDGAIGTNPSGGAGGAAGTATNGFFKVLDGQIGGLGGTGFNPPASTAGAVGVAGTAAPDSLGADGALGGDGSDGDGSNGKGGGAGGAVGAVTAPSAEGGSMRNIWQIALWKFWPDGATNFSPFFGGGAGSGGGGGGGDNGPGDGGGGGGGGGSASSAYPVYLAAKIIAGSGAINALGGDGGDGGDGNSSATTNGGGGGGGGGGHAGAFIKIFNDDTGSSITVTLTGGLGGALGANGSSGTAGANGGNGETFSFNVE